MIWGVEQGRRRVLATPLTTLATAPLGMLASSGLQCSGTTAADPSTMKDNTAYRQRGEDTSCHKPCIPSWRSSSSADSSADGGAEREPADQPVGSSGRERRTPPGTPSGSRTNTSKWRARGISSIVASSTSSDGSSPVARGATRGHAAQGGQARRTRGDGAGHRGQTRRLTHSGRAN